jgi:hypothetical protein
MSLRLRFLDLIALAAFAVLGVTAALAGSVTLRWTTPGDDSLTGRAARFDLRYSSQTITAVNFNQATAAVNLPVPGLPGVIQSARVDALQSGRLYYFAMKTADEVNNWSAMSNVISRLPQEVAGVEGTTALQFSAPWPNPARQATQFRLELPGPMQVQVLVFDVGGRQIRTLLDEPRGAGANSLTFDLRDERGAPLAQGIYLVRARLGDTVIMRRLVVTR